MLKKGGSNWVDGDRFFNREIEFEILEERVRAGTHTLLTAQRRMGKTSLVRELMRHLGEASDFETVFVDLEASMDLADMVAELGVQAKSARRAWSWIKESFSNALQEVGDRIDELAVSEVRVKLRAGIDAGNWPQRGDAIFSALADSERPVVLAIDELPILVSRLLKDEDGRITSEGKRETEALLSWLRKNGQDHRGQVTIILSGSVGLEPLLEQAGISAHANILSTFDLKPWSQETAVSCLDELSKSYNVNLPLDVRRDMCSRLRCCIPHHVQMYFDKLHDHLRRASRREASIDDVEWVYLHDMLGIRGQMDLQHYEERLRMILGRTDYPIALEILTHTAKQGYLNEETVRRYEEYFQPQDDDGVPSVKHVLHVLHHDGYLEQREDGARQFVSGLLEDWWRSRYEQNFVSAVENYRQHRRAEK